MVFSAGLIQKKFHHTHETIDSQGSPWGLLLASLCMRTTLHHQYIPIIIKPVKPYFGVNLWFIQIQTSEMMLKKTGFETLLHKFYFHGLISTLGSPSPTLL